jgi:eukaryotic-like serine/threonine-protein kinase
MKLGRYRIVRSIGRGGMGDVWLARYEALPGVVRLAAIKVLRPAFLSVSPPSKLFEEARVNAYVSHPNVVAVLEAGIDDGVAWLALEYVPGPTLRAIFDASQDRRPDSGARRVSPWVFASIAARACAGLAAVHDAKSETGQPLSIIHRDVSPQNLLVSWDGAVKLLDFGIARSAIAEARTATGTIKGKLGYMAPEQVRGQPVDKRTDIFALGVVLWEALARRSLFATENEAETYERVNACQVPPLAEVAPDVPPSLAAVAHRALAVEPSGRFWTALEMKQALDGAMMAANVAIAEPEIAASIAMLLPERVREHEAWLAEAARQGDLALATTVLASVRDGAYRPKAERGRDEDDDGAPPPKTERLASKGTVPLAKPISAKPISTSHSRSHEVPVVPPGVAHAPIPPPRTWPKPSTIVLVCAALVAIAGATFGTVVFVWKKRQGVDPSFRSTIPSGVQPDGRSLATDEPPSPPGTPETSQKAAPPWPTRTIAGDIGEYAPQLTDGLQAFMAAVPLADASVERALIVCRVHTFGKADTLSGDDLQVRAVLGATPLVANDGPEDANLAFVSAPLATLKKGDAVHFEVYDRDVFDLQAIENVHATWKGGALAARAANATIECRQLAGAPLQRLVSIRAARADASRDKLSRAELDGRTYDWAWPTADMKAAQKDVADVAGLVGWDDARVHRRVAGLDAAIASVEAKKPATFESLYAKANESAKVSRVTITARDTSCADHGAACTIRVTMKNDGDKPLMRTGWAGVTAYAANRESGPQPASFELRTMEGGSLDPGATLETTASPPRTLSLGNGPAILGVCRDGQCAAIRLR